MCKYTYELPSWCIDQSIDPQQVAEVATLVGSALLYYKLTTDPNSRAKMQQYAPVVMDAFYTATGGRYRDSDGGGDQ